MKVLKLTILMTILSIAAFGQSGRRISRPATTTETPSGGSKDIVLTEPQSTKKTDDAAAGGYSESRPNPRRLSVNSTPSMRSVPPPSTKQSNGSKDAETVSDDEDAVLKVETNLITIPVSVFDRNGLFIPDLEKYNFKIFEDGVEQPIEFFATSDNPVTVALVIDTSPSTSFRIEDIQNAAIAFVEQLKSTDSVIVVEFNGDVRVLAERTTDRQKIAKAIRRTDFGGGTALYDAIDVTVRRQLSKVEGRKAIVLFTDGVDTASRRSYEGSLNEAEESDATIFPIYYNTYLTNRGIGGGGGPMQSPIPNIGGMARGQQQPQGSRPEDYALGRQYLRDLADATGGRVYNADNTVAGLNRTFESIAEELSRQYSIGYIPENPGASGQRKAIKVRVNRPNLIIRARDSYIVGETSAKK